MWATDLGAPILSGVVPAGDLLLVGTYDGTLHALAHAAGSKCPDAPGCGGKDAGGCGVVGLDGIDGRSWTDGLLVVASMLAVRRRRRRP